MPGRDGSHRARHGKRDSVVDASPLKHLYYVALVANGEQNTVAGRGVDKTAGTGERVPPASGGESIRADATTHQLDRMAHSGRGLVGGEGEHGENVSSAHSTPRLDRRRQPMSGPTPLAPSAWHFPPADQADEHGVVGIGADLEPATIIGAYRHGLFPMPISAEGEREVIAWWSPHERGVLELDDLVVSRSLRRSCRRYEVTINADFDAVIGACATLDREGGWISPNIRAAYRRLHQLGWAHSVETWDDGVLVGGLYGLQINGLFAGESMFHTARDASKVALVALVSALEQVGGTFIDVQWPTDHLATLGVSRITQGSYFTRLREALASPSRSLASEGPPVWVAKSPRYLDRTQQRPMVQKPSSTQ